MSEETARWRPWWRGESRRLRAVVGQGKKSISLLLGCCLLAPSSSASALRCCRRRAFTGYDFLSLPFWGTFSGSLLLRLVTKTKKRLRGEEGNGRGRLRRHLFFRVSCCCVGRGSFLWNGFRLSCFYIILPPPPSILSFTLLSNLHFSAAAACHGVPGGDIRLQVQRRCRFRCESCRLRRRCGTGTSCRSSCHCCRRSPRCGGREKRQQHGFRCRRSCRGKNGRERTTRSPPQEGGQ